MTTHVVFSVLGALTLAADIASSHVGLGMGMGMREVGAFGKWTIPAGVGSWALLVFGGVTLSKNPAMVCTLLLLPFAIAHGIAANNNVILIRRAKTHGVRRAG